MVLAIRLLAKLSPTIDGSIEKNRANQDTTGKANLSVSLAADFYFFSLNFRRSSATTAMLTQ